MKISRAEVLHVADLARLKIDDASISLFAKQIDKVLDYIDTLNSIDTTSVEPTFHVISLSNAFREDKISKSFDRDAILANAPKTDGSLFLVPKVVG
jgi:aspartyl-tRNA(Asn)/glutamyl-tRNA(Gln) amidotransferase subunit C